MLYVIGVGLTVFAVAKLFTAYSGAVFVFLLLIFPPLVLTAVLFTEPAKGLFGDEQFQKEVKLGPGASAATTACSGCACRCR